MDNFDFKKGLWQILPDTISKTSMVVLTTKTQNYITERWF